MSLKTISLALTADSDPDPAVAVRYALGLASQAGVHLSVCIGVPPLVIPTLGYTIHTMASQMIAIIEREDVERRRRTEQMAETIRADAERAGAIASVEVFSAAYETLTPHLMHMARVSDLCITPAPVSTRPEQRDIVIDMLFGAGVPLLLVPGNWERPGPVRKAIVAWDGGASAARAVRDALPLLVDADSVEIVSILGEKAIEDEAPGADIARHLARHCRAVAINVLSVSEHGVAATLLAHAMLTPTDLVVMGGYGHSRLREFVLGGVTRDTLARTDIPTLLSH